MSSLGHYLCDTQSKAYNSPRVTAEVLYLTVHAVSTALLRQNTFAQTSVNAGFMYLLHLEGRMGLGLPTGC